MLTTSVSTASGVEFQWFRDGVAISGATNSTYSAAMPGSYTVQVSVPSGCSATTAALAVIQHPLPSPVVSYNATTHIVSTQSYFVTYQWYKDLALIPGATSATTVSTGNGMYKVAVTDTNGCQSFSTSFPLTGWTGGGTSGIATSQNGDISVYPNPASTVLFIQAPCLLNATLTTVDGRKIASYEAATEISVDNLPGGIYMLMLYNREGQLVKAEKVIKTGNR